MKYFVTSDYHLGHFNIIRYCGRPFKSLEEMNNTIIQNHNSRVKPEDVVFHIGDFCFKNTSWSGEGVRQSSYFWEQQLNGKIIHIRGNHDRNNSTKAPIICCTIKHGQYVIGLLHNPENIGLFHDSPPKLIFCGHVHQKWHSKTYKAKFYEIVFINVGVDVNKFMPITIDEAIKKRFTTKEGNLEV